MDFAQATRRRRPSRTTSASAGSEAASKGRDAGRKNIQDEMSRRAEMEANYKNQREEGKGKRKVWGGGLSNRQTSSWKYSGERGELMGDTVGGSTKREKGKGGSKTKNRSWRGGLLPAKRFRKVDRSNPKGVQRPKREPNDGGGKKPAQVVALHG